MLWQEMATDGVKQIVVLLLSAPRSCRRRLPDDARARRQPDRRLLGAPLPAICCGSSFTPTTQAPSCTGTAPGTQCTFVDTRPAFNGHSGAAGEPGPDYILSDHVHPNAMGSVVIADLTWNAMVANCVAQ